MGERPFTIRSTRVATLPNALSLIRILLLAPTLVVLEQQESVGTLVVLAVVALALSTDAADGLVARRRGSVSGLGRVLDPVADKIYLGGVVLYLALARDFPGWLVALVIARDLCLVLGSMFLLGRQRVVFAANLWGKLSTVLLGLLVLAYLLRLSAVWPWLAGVAGAAVVVSWISYARTGVRYLRAGATQAA